MLRRALRVASVASGAAVGAGNVALYVDAPEGDRGDGSYTGPREQIFPSWLHAIGRFPVTVGGTAISKFYLATLNKVTCEGEEHLVEAALKRKPKQALITVSNHSATVDDPAVIAAILPWRHSVPWNVRWSVVSQEYSYVKNGALSWFFFAAKVLPVKRGAGVDQPMLKVMFDKIQNGDWVHIFPEGKIEQRAILGGRSGPRVAEIGLLKWGTAKLIARADVRPVVVPFYHANMEKVMPQNENNKLISVIPKTGVHVKVRVGAPIDFEDLFEKYSDDRVVDSEAAWETQDREKPLYSAITKRIETTLLELAKDVYEP